MPSIFADRPSRDGFSGTIPEFIDWLQNRLVGGAIEVSVPYELDELNRNWRANSDNLARRITIRNGGYSIAERMSSRVAGHSQEFSWFAMSYWVSSTRNIDEYVVRCEDYDNDKPQKWLDRQTNALMSIYHPLELLVRTPNGDQFSVDMPSIHLSFHEDVDSETMMSRRSGILVAEALEVDDKGRFYSADLIENISFDDFDEPTKEEIMDDRHRW